MRTFIAIPLNDEVHGKLAKLQGRLQGPGIDVKWVHPSNIHLTLKFLGEIDEKEISKIKDALVNIAKSYKPFYISIAKVSAFPTPSHPRVVWVGIEEGKEECEVLEKDIEDAMEKLRFKKEDRPFTAHLTLGRVRSSKNKHQLVKLLEKERDALLADKIHVGNIILFQSNLMPGGPIYTPIGEFPLS